MVIVWLFTLNSSIIDNVLPWLINLIVLQAVCCTDGKHCCPGGTTCDVSSGKCNRGDLTVVDWIEKVPAIITDVICPDGQSKCQTGQTCCKMATGDYGCCPIPKVRLMPLFNYLSFIILFLRLMIWKSVVRAPDNFQVQRLITPYFWKWWVFAYFLCTVVLSTSEKIAYMYMFKIMFDTSVIQ